MDNCIFCKIANGEIKTDFVYENDKVVVFKDINPLAPIHLLVVPKKHYADLNEIDDKNILAELLNAVKEVCKKEGIKSYRTVINTGSESGQEVFHIHVHILSGKKLGSLC